MGVTTRTQYTHNMAVRVMFTTAVRVYVDCLLEDERIRNQRERVQLWAHFLGEPVACAPYRPRLFVDNNDDVLNDKIVHEMFRLLDENRKLRLMDRLREAGDDPLPSSSNNNGDWTDAAIRRSRWFYSGDGLDNTNPNDCIPYIQRCHSQVPPLLPRRGEEGGLSSNAWLTFGVFWNTLRSAFPCRTCNSSLGSIGSVPLSFSVPSFVWSLGNLSSPDNAHNPNRFFFQARDEQMQNSLTHCFFFEA